MDRAQVTSIPLGLTTPQEGVPRPSGIVPWAFRLEGQLLSGMLASAWVRPVPLPSAFKLRRSFEPDVRH
jgi:hypothetical protein